MKNINKKIAIIYFLLTFGILRYRCNRFAKWEIEWFNRVLKNN